ncbi:MULTISPECIES: hypothetical protein [unclassified Streptomyces]|uniref:hypothetical protein n=1 Tax=unclassified Streptomyces TaxID=2593676 RepID=UPI0035E28404
MKRCQSCGYPITGKAREVTPHSDATARPTLYLHETAEECAAAKRERIASPLRRHR